VHSNRDIKVPELMIIETKGMIENMLQPCTDGADLLASVGSRLIN